jgi:ribonuclease-3
VSDRREPTDTGARARPDLAELSLRLGHTFTEPELLARALAHRSWCAEHGGQPSNERLEFLGDAVLGWVVADLVFRRYGELAEGKLTDLRKSVVSERALAEVATELELGPHLLLGRGEDAAGGRRKDSILADALEAVIGAVYLDGGADAAYELVERLLRGRLERAVERLDRLDHKTMLQELAARHHDAAPVYVLHEEGPDHAKRFFASVYVLGRLLGEGEGRSKKLAEQAAAEVACARLAASRTV